MLQTFFIKPYLNYRVDRWYMQTWSNNSYKDACKRNLKSLNVGTAKWEDLANDRDKWRSPKYKSTKVREKHFFKRRK